jgi:hypothetical protein
MDNDEFKEKLIQWIVENIDAWDCVPDDEGNTEALIFNLIQLARFGRPCEFYSYEKWQDDDIKNLYNKYDRDYYE